MMRYGLQIATFAIMTSFLAAVESFAATVCSSGADHTTGAAALNALRPGEEVLFCAGETHFVKGTYRLGDLQGAYVGAYGTGEIPTLMGGLNFDGAATSGITFDGLRFRGDGRDHGIRINSGSSDITIMNSIIENYSVGLYVKKNTGALANRNISLINSVIQNNGSQGFLGGGPGLYVGYNTFIDNGHNGWFDHNIYVGCSTDTPDGEPCPQIIEFNHLQGASKDAEGRCQGAEIVVHGYVNGLIIRNNVVREPDGRISSCYGIMVSPGYPTREWMANVTITENEIYGGGRVGIGVEEVDGIYVARNTVVNSDAEFTMIGVQIKGGGEEEIGGNSATNVLIEDNYFNFSGSGGNYKPVYIWAEVRPPITVENNEALLDAIPGTGGYLTRPPVTPPAVDNDDESSGSSNATDPGSAESTASRPVSPGMDLPEFQDGRPVPNLTEPQVVQSSLAQVVATGVADSRGRIKIKGTVLAGETVLTETSALSCRTIATGSFRCMGRYLGVGTMVRVFLE